MTAASKPENVVAQYQDLESDICDLRNMSSLANSFIEDSLSGQHMRVQIGGQKMIAITIHEADIILFSSYQVEKMARELKEKYLAILEEPK